jgi:hypothetical protein
MEYIATQGGIRHISEETDPGCEILKIVRNFARKDLMNKKSARSKGFVAKRARLAQNPHKREDLP